MSNLKVYDVETVYNRSQTHSVIARDMGEAERVYLEKYGPCTIFRILLHSQYVIVQPGDASQRKELIELNLLRSRVKDCSGDIEFDDGWDDKHE